MVKSPAQGRAKVLDNHGAIMLVTILITRTSSFYTVSPYTWKAHLKQGVSDPSSTRNTTNATLMYNPNATVISHFTAMQMSSRFNFRSHHCTGTWPFDSFILCNFSRSSSVNEWYNSWKPGSLDTLLKKSIRYFCVSSSVCRVLHRDSSI